MRIVSIGIGISIIIIIGILFLNITIMSEIIQIIMCSSDKRIYTTIL